MRIVIPDVANRFPVSVDALLHVPSEVRIGHRRIAELFFVCLGQRDALADFAAHWFGLLHHGERPVIFTLDDDLVATLDVFENGSDIAHEFGFGDAQSHTSLRS
jgi:hypothetical protein